MSQFVDEIMDPLFNIVGGMLYAEMAKNGGEGNHGATGLGELLSNELTELNELDTFENELAEEIRDQRIQTINCRIYEIKKNKRLNIGVHMLLTFTC